MSDATRHTGADIVGKKTGKGGKRPGSGRKPGTPNKITKALKDQILGALEAKNGQEWLEKQMDEQPAAFLTLLGKILPSEINGKISNPDGSPLFGMIERVVIDSRKK